MLDIRWIREHAEEVQTAAVRKGIDFSVDKLLERSGQKHELQQQVEALRASRNDRSKRIGNAISTGGGKDQELAERLRAEVSEVNRALHTLEQQLTEAERELEQLMLRVPNVVSADTPVGRSDADNVELRRFGAPPEFGFEPKDHVELGERHRLIDLPRGVKIAGSRSYFLTGMGAQLHRAVQQLAIDLLMDRGFTLLEVPLMVRSEALVGTGFSPLGEEQTFRMADSERWLVGTSEVPLASYYGNEIVDVFKPIKLAAASACFRSEVGSAGRDAHGLYRVHQFAKVEQVVICRNDAEESEQLLQEITAHAEEILRLLELPYRVMAVCTGDMSQKTYKQYDIETWMPGRLAYGETHSSSNLHDFQARRLNLRYRDAQGKLRFCHTLNNTAVASPRILIPLLENHQEEDGSVRIPAALRPYLQGIERLSSKT